MHQYSVEFWQILEPSARFKRMSNYGYFAITASLFICEVAKDKDKLLIGLSDFWIGAPSQSPADSLSQVSGYPPIPFSGRRRPLVIFGIGLWQLGDYYERSAY